MAEDLDAQVAVLRHRPLDAGPYSLVATEVYARRAPGRRADRPRVTEAQVTTSTPTPGWSAG